jgi:hypothetical protein
MASNARRSLRVDPRKWVLEVPKNLVGVGRSVAVRSERVLVMGPRDVELGPEEVTSSTTRETSAPFTLHID